MSRVLKERIHWTWLLFPSFSPVVGWPEAIRRHLVVCTNRWHCPSAAEIVLYKSTSQSFGCFRCLPPCISVRIFYSSILLSVYYSLHPRTECRINVDIASRLAVRTRQPLDCWRESSARSSHAISALLSNWLLVGSDSSVAEAAGRRRGVKKKKKETNELIQKHFIESARARVCCLAWYVDYVRYFIFRPCLSLSPTEYLLQLRSSVQYYYYSTLHSIKSHVQKKRIQFH